VERTGPGAVFQFRGAKAFDRKVRKRFAKVAKKNKIKDEIEVKTCPSRSTRDERDCSRIRVVQLKSFRRGLHALNVRYIDLEVAPAR
jgi:hypothetical protein